MSKKRFAKLLILCIVAGGLFQCFQESKKAKVKNDSLDSMKNVEDSFKAILSDKVLLKNDLFDSLANASDGIKSILSEKYIGTSSDLKFSYNDSLRILSLIYNNKKNILGEFRNTFDIAPNVETKQADSAIYIIVLNKFFDLGQGFDEITLFLFDKKQQTIKKLLQTDEVGIHDINIDTLMNIKHYDYFINEEKQKFVIEEYSPYKFTNNKKQKYQTTVRVYSFKK